MHHNPTSCGSYTQAVLARGLVVAEVYDIMGRVQCLLVRAQATPVRELAASVRHSAERLAGNMVALHTYALNHLSTTSCTRAQLSSLRVSKGLTSFILTSCRSNSFHAPQLWLFPFGLVVTSWMCCPGSG